MPVVGHHQDRSAVLIGVVQHRADRPIKLLETVFGHIASNRIAIRPAGVQVLPGLVLEVVHQFEHDHQHVPAVAVAQPFRHRDALMEAVGQVGDVLGEELVSAAELLAPLALERRVGPALENQFFQIRRVREIRIRSGSVEPGDHKAVDRNRRIRHRHVDAADPKTSIPEDLKDVANMLGASCAVQAKSPGAHVVPFEVQDAVRPGLPSGQAGRPGGRRDRRNGGIERAGRASLDRGAKAGHPPLRHERIQNGKGRPVQPQNEQLFGHRSAGAIGLVTGGFGGRFARAVWSHLIREFTAGCVL